MPRSLLLTWFIWWRHQIETFSALLVLCEGNPSVTAGFPSQRPVTRSFDILFDLRLSNRFNKHSRRRWFETQSRSLWRHCNEVILRCGRVRIYLPLFPWSVNAHVYYNLSSMKLRHIWVITYHSFTFNVLTYQCLKLDAGIVNLG